MLVFPKHGVFSENTMFYIECLQSTMFKKKIDKFRGSWFFRWLEDDSFLLRHRLLFSSFAVSFREANLNLRSKEISNPTIQQVSKSWCALSPSSSGKSYLGIENVFFLCFLNPQNWRHFEDPKPPLHHTGSFTPPLEGPMILRLLYM